MTYPLNRLTETEMSACTAEEAGCGLLRTEAGLLPLLAMDVRASIDGLTSRIEMRQRYRNPTETPLEATYIFPLPDRAAVHEFTMTVGDQVTRGVIKERGEARAAYEQAIEAGHRAAITEEERSGVFTMRVGNLMPGDVAEIAITLTGPVAVEYGQATFRVPLVVAPRYIAGQALGGEDVGDGIGVDTDQVPDASRITPPVLLPGFPNPVRLSVCIDLDGADLAVSELRSSLHAVHTQQRVGRTRIELHPGERLNRDFILRWKLGAEKIQTQLRLSPDSGGDGGTFAMTLVPPAMTASDRPRDIAFVLDRSGSMGGWKMVAARRAVGRMIDTLGSQDHFTVLAFDHDIETTPVVGAGEGLAAASDRNRYRTIEWLATVDARGGTEMEQPLASAARLLAGGYQDRERVLVLVTDGQVGAEDRILSALAGAIKNVRIFTIGIDRAVNEGFLRRLATLGGGATTLVESEDRLDDAMDGIHRRIATPVVGELSVVADGFEIERDSVVPRRLPDLFEGVPLTIRGRYRGRAEGTVHISGTDALGNRWQHDERARVADSNADTVLWARGQVRELEDLYAIGDGDLSALAQTITETSIRFGVLCRFTAFVAVDDSQIVNAGGEGHRVIQPVEQVDGWAQQEQDARPAMIPASLSAGLPAQAMAAPPEPMACADMSFASGSIGGGRKDEAPRAARAPAPRAPKPPALRRAPADLTSYAHRLERLLRAAQPSAASLRRLVVELRQLIADLRSVGGPARALELIEIEADRLRSALGASASDAELATVLSEARANLDGCLAGPRGRSRLAFWK